MSRVPPAVLEGHEGPQHAVRRRKVALELDHLAFGAFENLQEIHSSEVYSEGAAETRLPSRQ
jgi:hypothetical protein